MISTGERYRLYICEDCGSTCWRPSRAKRLYGDCSAPLPTDHSATKDRLCSGHLTLRSEVDEFDGRVHHE